MMTLATCKRCLVIGCKRVAETTWEPDIRPGESRKPFQEE
jgi:hypothetical protein